MKDRKRIPGDHAERTIATYDVIATRYHLANTPQRLAAKRAAMDVFLRQLPGAEGMRVLVPGCGLGDDVRYLRAQGVAVDAFDLSLGMLRLAHEADPNGSYLQLDLRDILRLEHSYNGVWARGCLYHLTPPELEQWFKDCAILLQPGGVLYFSLKEGHGQEMRSTPAPGYSGGAQARAQLLGERYYAYYTAAEIEPMVTPWFKVLRHEPIHGMQPAFEYWLQKRATD